MSFDGLFTHALVQELSPILVGGRLSRIQQPFAQELILTIRNHRQNYSLLLSANPNYARVQLTELKFQSPKTPSNFVMTLRKQLDSAILQAIQQIENDRILTLTFQNRNELGDLQEITFYVEIMNRHSNIVVVNNQSQLIIDAIKHVDLSQDRYRQLLPKETYRLPPAQNKINPFDVFEREKWLKQNEQQLFQNDSAQVARIIQTNFQGFDKSSAQELSTRSQTHTANSSLKQIWQDFLTGFNHPQATIATKQYRQLFTAQKYVSLTAANFQQQAFPSLSQMLDDFYQDRARQDRVRQQASNILQLIKRYLKRNQTKLKRLQQDLAKTESAEDYRIQGELLTTYLNQVQRGQQSVQLPNYYDNNQLLTIKLNPAKSPATNAQQYFKTYQKLKNSIRHLNEQIEQTKVEINYLEGILAQISYAEPQDLADIQLELTQQGYIKKQTRKKQRKTKIQPGETFQASDQTIIRVGKNNLQNDYLTNKLADKRYTWLHIKNLPGSHVIIESLAPSEQTLLEAAELAAYFSKAGANASKVPIDYTLVKHVHKPNGAKPGFVIYTDQKTLLVDPQLHLKQLK